MKLKLKPIEIGETEQVINNCLNRLETLKILQANTTNLSNAELLKLFAINYNLQLDEKDFQNISKAILKSNDVKKGRIKTTIAKQVKRSSSNSFFWHEWYDILEQDAIVYYKDDMGLNFNHVYSEEELQELIANKKLVLITFITGHKTTLRSKISNVCSDEFLTLKNISLDNLGIYEDLIIKSLKRKVQSKRFAKDICKIINDIRQNINMRKMFLLNSIIFHENGLKEDWAEYDLCVSNLDSLMLDKSEAMRVLERK